MIFKPEFFQESCPRLNLPPIKLAAFRIKEPPSTDSCDAYHIIKAQIFKLQVTVSDLWVGRQNLSCFKVLFQPHANGDNCNEHNIYSLLLRLIHNMIMIMIMITISL